MKIIALCYKKGVGKNTLGKFIMTHLRCKSPGTMVKHISFAGKLKDICFQLYGWAGLERGVYYESYRDKKEEILPLLGCTPREIWIGFGNKVREHRENTWLDYAFKGESADIGVLTDCGFWNEATAVKEAGGMLCRIDRDGLPQGTDAREVELDGCDDSDYIVHNNSTFEYLHNIAEKIADRLLGVVK